MDFIKCLQSRGLFSDATSIEELKETMKCPLLGYVGFDPTAPSLHVGNLVGIIVLGWLQRLGHTPVILLGGITGLIGDPSGKSQERPLLDEEVVAQNVASIRAQLSQILDFSGKLPKPIFVNNADWFQDFSLIRFLRDVGKHFRVGTMLAKESVKQRISSEEGISFTEFSYQMIQAYDFFHLKKEKKVSLQMGGSDQWGNITAGVELIRRMKEGEAYGLTWPLLTRSDGKKFGKSEGGAVWLSSELCSFHDFYQYFFRIPDADVLYMMRMLTFMELEEIAEIEAEMKGKGYIPNTAQKRLAEEMTRIVHGEEGLEKAKKAAEGLGFGREGINFSLLEEGGADVPQITLKKEEVIGASFPELAVKTTLLPSKSEALRLLKNGGAYFNDEKIEDPQYRVLLSDLLKEKYLLVGAGKRKKILIKIEEN